MEFRRVLFRSTEKVVEHARLKLDRKGCDWILANDVAPGTATFGGDRNRIQLVTAEGVDDWPQMTKAEVAERLCRQIAATLGRHFDQQEQGTRSLRSEEHTSELQSLMRTPSAVLRLKKQN